MRTAALSSWPCLTAAAAYTPLSRPEIRAQTPADAAAGACSSATSMIQARQFSRDRGSQGSASQRLSSRRNAHTQTRSEFTEPFVTSPTRTPRREPASVPTVAESACQQSPGLVKRGTRWNGRKLMDCCRSPRKPRGSHSPTVEDACGRASGAPACAFHARCGRRKTYARSARARSAGSSIRRNAFAVPRIPRRPPRTLNPILMESPTHGSANGLKPNDSKGRRCDGKDGYSQIEVYINSRARPYIHRFVQVAKFPTSRPIPNPHRGRFITLSFHAPELDWCRNFRNRMGQRAKPSYNDTSRFQLLRNAN
jgi:hypothetical protein